MPIWIPVMMTAISHVSVLLITRKAGLGWKFWKALTVAMALSTLLWFFYFGSNGEVNG
jgi:hypothetical protein